MVEEVVDEGYVGMGEELPGVCEAQFYFGVDVFAD